MKLTELSTMRNQPDNRSLKLNEIEKDVESWDKRLQRLQDVFDRSGADINDAYISTLDELRFALDRLRGEVVKVRDSVPPPASDDLKRLREVRDETQRLFDVKLSTMRHQKL